MTARALLNPAVGSGKTSAASNGNSTGQATPVNAMTIAIGKLVEEKQLPVFPVKDFLAAVSVGLLEEGAVADLDYVEDFAALVDMNLVMTGNGELVEIQGTGEEATFSRKQLNELLDLGEAAIQELIRKQKEVLGPLAEEVGVQTGGLD